MDNDEEQISQIIGKQVAGYIVDDGFTCGVIRKVKKQRRRRFTRRPWILAISVAGCLVAALLTWAQLSTEATICGAKELGGAADLAGATLAWSMILAAALSSVVCLIARVEDAG